MTETANQKQTARLEAFSDGVFAIAITLLVLDIRVPALPAADPATGVVPGVSDHWLLERLRHEWTAYVAYVMSFAVILITWVNHHRIIALLARTDHRFLFWNGLLLMMIAIVPFPTSLLARYFLTPAAKVGAAIYAGHGLMVALAFQGVWQHAIRTRGLLAPGTERDVARLNAQYRFGPWMYLVALLLAFVSAPVSVGLCLLFAVFFSLQGFRQKG